LIQIKHEHAKKRSFSLLGNISVGDREPSIMAEAADYSVRENLRDGRPVKIRALRPDDQADMLAAIGRTSMQSLQRRFFAPKKGFSEREIAFFLNIDFESHFALVAQIDEDRGPAIVGGGRFIVVRPGQAEIAFIVVDAYQGQGVGTILMRHLAALARDAGLKELIAEVLSENIAMLKVFRKFGFKPGSKREPLVVHLVLQLA
jgi:RimJ/RimL family protein N-acetyltransferase